MDGDDRTCPFGRLDVRNRDWAVEAKVLDAAFAFLALECDLIDLATATDTVIGCAKKLAFQVFSPLK